MTSAGHSSYSNSIVTVSVMCNNLFHSEDPAGMAQDLHFDENQDFVDHYVEITMDNRVPGVSGQHLFRGSPRKKTRATA